MSKNPSKGMVLVNVLIFATIAVVITTGLVNWSVQIFRSVKNLQQKEQALQIAEAGIEYYRWHLAHSPSDFRDGTTNPGPYVHNFADESGNILGTYSLTITPPPIGSTLVKIRSVGTLASSSISRTLLSTLAIPSFAKYAFVANDFMRFGAGTVVNGPIHANQGIHFDGIANNVVASALSTTTDPDVSCSPYPACALRWAVFTESGANDPNPPTVLPNRPDVFVAGRQLSNPAVSFSGITANFNQLQVAAIASDPITNKYNIAASGSGNYGYHIIFYNNNGTTTYDLKKVKSLRSVPNQCGNDASQTNWGSWSIGNTGNPEQTISTGNKLPSNGVIFVADNVWVDGRVGNGARVTIAAAKLPQPATPPDIIINADLSYATQDGSNSIGLIAQGNVTVGLYSDTDLEIDAALVAQTGRVGRYYYNSDCGSTYTRNSLTLYGMIATYVRYGFSYTGSNFNCGGAIGNIGSGYCVRDVTYDPDLLYGPPPSFPLSSSSYIPLSWQEVN
ncbi:MAG: pilus assembly PilX N-terminal domain-containing protein [Candidatus Paceibacterota bacterium]|jgi:type II secretory pathway pseudopilin PulG